MLILCYSLTRLFQGFHSVCRFHAQYSMCSDCSDCSTNMPWEEAYHITGTAIANIVSNRNTWDTVFMANLMCLKPSQVSPHHGSAYLQVPHWLSFAPVLYGSYVTCNMFGFDLSHNSGLGPLKRREIGGIVFLPTCGNNKV